ncbi:TadE-like protein [Saccharopolyspora shandongensis]|uniref:TadE-like protein n=1 Tax=Saccharopolyspora shandongensis TaxID=418495 RepID=A0A1H3GF24_9PSEU|nr:TadE family protein [Saccharopolyspora shandongensis]SDY01248.1 TadE-like protein [Saccharopolyspora shandongensis]
MNRYVRDDGSASIELAILTPALLMLLALIVAGGRVVSADTAVEHAATAAARAASLARTPTAARTTALDTGARVLADQDLACTDIQLTTDTSGFGRVGAPGIVTVTLRCAVALADLTSIPGLPVAVPLHAAFTSPVDPHRSRS